MEFKNYTYLIILAASIAAPLFLSFDKKVQYYKNLKYILPAIILTAAIFLLWDIKFTASQVWSFNPEYTIGKNFKGLPIEEWLFFLVIPYSCVFIYEVVGFALISYFYRHQAYTFLCFLFSAIYLAYTVFRNRFKQHITKFYFSYFISLIPFIVVNGILTSMPVVEYNTAHILNIRFLNIPVEDFSYLFLMLLMVITIYETLKASKYY